MASASEGGPLAIRTRSLAKNFGPVEALRGLDLEVRRGEIFGFLGRNGAGKTTTIRILLGLVRPGSGEVELFGRPLKGHREELLSRLGYFVEGSSAYPNLTVRENLEIQRRLRSAPRGAVGEAIELLGLGSCADRRAGQLSMGNRQRLSLARALLGGPELLILDEPANGLDPAGIVEVRELLRRLASEKGTTIFMSSHILAEVDRLADRIAIIDRGRLVEEEGRGGLRAESRRFIDLRFGRGSRLGEAERILREGLSLSQVEPQGEHGLRVSDPGARAPDLARALVAAGLELEMLRPVEEGLEERFMRLTGGRE
jgi:ABC-2 type transport system ATP-binding protein